jgi:hypothetical protein
MDINLKFRNQKMPIGRREIGKKADSHNTDDLGLHYK